MPGAVWRHFAGYGLSGARRIRQRAGNIYRYILSGARRIRQRAGNIYRYILSGARKPKMLMQISNTFSVRVIRATNARRVSLFSSAKIFLS